MALAHAPVVLEDSPRNLPIAVVAEPSRSTSYELWFLVATVCCACAVVMHGKRHGAARSGEHVTRRVTRRLKHGRYPCL